MDEGRIVAWHKREGDAVAAGDILFEVETDKATMEVESPTAGTLRKILYPADATAPVATVIALITETADEPHRRAGALGSPAPLCLCGRRPSPLVAGRAQTGTGARRRHRKRHGQWSRRSGDAGGC